MKRSALAVVLGAVIALASIGATPEKKWTCSLTGQTVQKCCCVVQKDGKLYCTLAKKTVDPCCCKEAKSK